MRSGVGFKHLETFEIGDSVFIGAQAYIQGRFDGTTIIGDHVWIGPQAYMDARDLVLEDTWAGAQGRRCSAPLTPGSRLTCPSCTRTWRSSRSASRPGQISARTPRFFPVSPLAAAPSSGRGLW